ncbi:MAG: CDP-archaeol synthase [Nitrospirota bacterium]|nr:CDP-archaeol synthase [Nitrospirota bacterium]
MIYLQLLFLIIVANGAPIIGRWIMNGFWEMPIDGGAVFIDGRPILGTSKTYRGLACSLAGTLLAGALVGLSWKISLIVSALAMVGDCLSSFVKRRFGYPSGGKALWLDQIPESLLPMLGLWNVLNMSALGVGLTVVVFVVVELALSPIGHKLHIRKHSY